MVKVVYTDCNCAYGENEPGEFTEIINDRCPKCKEKGKTTQLNDQRDAKYSHH